MELALRARAGREVDVGDMEREERRDRGEVELAAAAVVVVVTMSKVTARGGEGPTLACPLLKS